jgi:hypothetical protein
MHGADVFPINTEIFGVQILVNDDDHEFDVVGGETGLVLSGLVCCFSRKAQPFLPLGWTSISYWLS